MQIVVPIKQILDPAGITFRRDKERMFVNRKDYIIEPGSKSALEAALRLKDENGEHLIQALSMGEPRAGDALREALAMGADEAYLLAGDAFGAADTAVTARILAAAIEKLAGASLIITGRASHDTGCEQIGGRLAAALDCAQVTGVYALVVDGDRVRATRRWGETFASVTAPLPAVVTIAPGAFPPRHAHGARIMSAYRDWQVQTWSPAGLGLDEQDLTPLLDQRSESFPPPLETGERFEGDPQTIAAEAIMALKLQKLVP
jgi:electron transfer flavoprotein beta subunit